MSLEIPVQFNLAAHFVDRPAAQHPDRLAIAGLPGPVTYGQVGERVNRVGNALRTLGCEPGERVLIVLPDSVEFVAAFFGAAKIGAVAVPVNPMTRAADFAYYLSDSGAHIAIVHESALAEFLPAVKGRALNWLVTVPSPSIGTSGGAKRAGGRVQTLTWEEWISSEPASLVAHETSSTDTAFFLYTSGSGGTPKAVIHQHKDMLVTAESFAQGVLGLRPEDRTFSVSKLYFAYGLGNGMYFPFSVGASTVFNPERPKPDRVLQLLRRYEPTVFFSVPTFYAALLREPGRDAKAAFASVRLAVSAGEALPAEIFEQFRMRFDVEILDGIGSTEMLHMFIASRSGQARPGSCGVEVPNYEATIVDDAEQPVRRGEMGNLWVKGRSAFAGYWNKPELTEKARRGAWVVTGDKFIQDADGYFHYCGRADDMMKVSGLWVSPTEVENVLLAHPLVAEAAVVAKQDPMGLQRPVAYLVLRGGAETGPHLVREIQEFVRGRLAHFKCPQEIEFVEELPKTPTGKIQRFRLRAAAP